MITINGKKINVAEINLDGYLKNNRFNTERIVIELNGDILPKSEYKSTILKENDVAEILTFVGGG